MCLLKIIKENVYFIEIGFKEDWGFKNLFSNYVIFREHVKTVKIYKVKFNVTTSDRLKIMGVL